MGDKPITMLSNEEAKKPTSLDEEEDIEALAELPDWLPDGWFMEVYCDEDGNIIRYYTSPISNCTFTTKLEVLEYLFSGTDENLLQSNERGAENTFEREREWLPKGWVMEIRAGGEKIDKMYKFYVHSTTGVRLLSKQDVLLYIKEGKVSGSSTHEQCDTSSEDNIHAKVDFWPSGLPKGWVKEVVYRKTKEGLIRKDPYYTDPASSYTFRTLKSALSFLQTGKVIPRRSFIQKTSVHDLYSFEISTDLHESLRSRLIIHEKPYQEPTRSSLSRRGPKIEHDQNIDDPKDGDTSSCSDSANKSEEENYEENISNKKASGKKST